MEYPSKRQKMSRPTIQIPRPSPELVPIEELSISAVGRESEGTHGAKQAVLGATSRDSELQERGTAPLVPQLIPEHSIPQRPRLQRRNAEPAHILRDENKTVTKSVVNVIIDEGTTAVAALTITDPSVAHTVSISDIGIVTIPPITTVPTTITTKVSSPTAVPSSTPSASPGPSTSDSQTVLSSPPTTPIASPSPSSSLSHSSSHSDGLPSGLLPAVSALNSGRNVTISVFTSTGLHTTITGTSIIDLATVSSNHTSSHKTTTKHTTLTTSIRHSSQGESGAASTTLFSGASGSAASQTGMGSGVGGGAAGTATASGSGSAASTTAAGGSGHSGSNQGPPTPTVVGGVVGGVAGLTIVLLLLLVILRWWKRKGRQRSVDDEPSTQALPPSTPSNPSASPAMTQRPSSHTPLMSALSPAFLSRWRMSGQTASSGSTVPLPPVPQERGFQKVSGRKIDSVLTSGGDGYGGASSSKETAPGPPPVLSGTSFYRDSQGFYGGVGQPSPRPSGQIQRESGVPSVPDDGSDIIVMRPSPARTPVTSEAGVSVREFPAPPRPPGSSTPPRSVRTGTPPLHAPSPLHPRDAVGRSHPSFDGSRGSRFTESV